MRLFFYFACELRRREVGGIFVERKAERASVGKSAAPVGRPPAQNVSFSAFRACDFIKALDRLFSWSFGLVRWRFFCGFCVFCTRFFLFYVNAMAAVVVHHFLDNAGNHFLEFTDEFGRRIIAAFDSSGKQQEKQLMTTNCATQ